ncbi:neural cell adhesion molecule 2-like [Tigriopus californicus]|nr:neural cell adhesion molecule 2-like [Tigriopus californicus]
MNNPTSNVNMPTFALGSTWALVCLVCATTNHAVVNGDAARGYSSSPSSSGQVSSLVSTSLVYQSGETALLPCDISVPDESKGDELSLIMWYREDVKSPIYSIDARTGVHIPTVNDIRSHWIDTNLFGHNRVVFDTSPGPDRARLKIYNVSESDDGLYRCRVDFKASQTRTSRVNLTVIVRPQKPLIRNFDSGDIVQGYLGPYQIGTRLSLLCQVIGGKPRPRVIWYRNDRPLNSISWSSTDPDTGFDIMNNNITIEALTRKDVHSEFTCEATNFDNIVQRTSVELDLKYQAHNVSILRKNTPLRAGSQHEFMCQAFGSRPAASLTWWFGDLQIRPDYDHVHITSSASGETSISTLTYTPKHEDNGQTLRCRSTNPEIHRGVLEDNWTLDVQYPPIVEIRLGKSLVASAIRQGVDVYFDCLIKANPSPKTKIVTWLHNGQILKQNRHDDPRARMVLPSVNDPNSLVLQGVKKAARGNYSCRVGNGIPTHDYEVQAQPKFLDVKFPPVCTPKGVKVYGVAKMETAHIACMVEANPPEVNFRWTFNNSAEAKQVEQRFIHTNASRSILTFTPTRTLEYGTLMCWSRNSVGEQRDPCVFHIIAAGKPEAVQNCTVVNESTDSFQVHCSPGFNGGLPQQFRLAVYKVHGTMSDRMLVANLTSPVPSFSVTGLQPGSHYLGEIHGFNVKGVGVPFMIRVYTLKLPEKLIPPISVEPSPNNKLHQISELNPWMLTLLGIGAGVLVVIVLVAIAIRFHVGRGSRSCRSRCTESATNRVVVTTIEDEMDLDQNAQRLMLLESRNGGSLSGKGWGDDDSQDFDEFITAPDIHHHQHAQSQHQSQSQNQQQRPPDPMSKMVTIRHSGSKDCLTRRGSGGLPPPNLNNPSGQSMRPADFCTLRRAHPTNGSQMNNNTLGNRRNVQFADQNPPPNMGGSAGEVIHGSPRKQAPHLLPEKTHMIIGPPAYPNPPPVGAPRHPHSAFMYATLRPGQQRKESGTFHEFIPPPPPPMFETGMLPPPPPLTSEEKKEKKKRESTV